MSNPIFIDRLYPLLSIKGGNLVSHGVVSVGDLTSMLLYTVYVGNGLSLLSSVYKVYVCVLMTEIRL